jgi:hypothetical protein
MPTTLFEHGNGGIVLFFRRLLRHGLDQGSTTHREVNCVGVFGARPFFRLGNDQLMSYGLGQSRHDLILQLE